LVCTEILEISPVVLVETLEAVVHVDGGLQILGERKGEGACRCADWAGAEVVVALVDFLGAGGGEDEAEAETDADGAWVGGGVLRMM
jgi:hypothetical protein